MIDNKLKYAIQTSGKSKSVHDFNILNYFYENYDKHPFVYQLSFNDTDSLYHNWYKVKKDLNNEFDINVLFLSKVNNDDSVYVAELTEGVIIQAMCIDSNDIFDEDMLINNDNILLREVEILSNKELDDKLYNKIYNIIEKHKVEEKPIVDIGMVSISDGDYYVKEFNITDSVIDLKEFDLHYGEGFNDFKDKLLDKMLNVNKGLVLFHGSPGSGKTTFVRYLLKQIIEKDNKNSILYFPPTMVDAVTDPSFIDFISSWASETIGKKYLLIEDAEPLLESREHSRNMGITNLLNMTDGLLNDILNIQIIATFNTDLKNIDDALLRPERLIARKNFKNLDKESALKIAKLNNIDQTLIRNNMSLAEIYSLKNKTNTLIHDISDERKIGFGLK